MQNVLGLLVFVVFCAAIVGAAAGLTWLVVKLFPPKNPEAAPKT